MKKFFTLICGAALGCASMAAQEGCGIYLTGDMNEWKENDPQWEFKAEPEIPGWAYIDLTDLPAGTNFRIMGEGRKYGMKNTRNTIRQNSMHLMTLDGANNLVACEEGLDGVHLMVQSDVFKTDKYIGILTITDASKVLYGACMESSVTPTLLNPSASVPAIVEGEVDITEPWYVVRAYELSNATQTVCNYGLSDTEGKLQPTSNLAPTAAAIPVPASGSGVHKVEFDTLTYAYAVDGDLGVEGIAASSDTSVRWYNLQGIPVADPQQGRIYIRVSEGRAAKVIL